MVNQQNNVIFRMKTQAVYTFLLFLCSDVTSDWIEIPQISVNRKANLQNVLSLDKLTTLSTPIIAVLSPTEVVETATLSSKLNEHPTNKNVVLIQSLPMVKGPFLKVNNLIKEQKRNATNAEITTEEKPNSVNDKSEFKNVEASNDSDIINETLEEAKRDIFNKPNTSLSQKLKYLHKMEGEMSTQISK